MMFIVLLMYCLSWFPVKLFQLLGNYQLISYCSEGQFFTLIYSFIAFHWLAMANSFVNPIIYSYMSISFRVSNVVLIFQLINNIIFNRMI